MNLKNKHLRDTICIWIACILAFLLAFTWFYSDVELLNLDIKEIAQIHLVEVDKERAIVYMTQEEIAEWAKKLEAVELERQTIAFSQKGGDYRIEIYNQKGKKSTNIIFRSKDRVQIKHRTYKIKGDTDLYDEIKSLFAD